jgi:hypothetical protein
MVTDSSAMQHGEFLIAAKDRIQMGPVPDWVDVCPFRIDFAAKQAGHVTHLLFDRQIHAELHQTYFHVALRLDTMQAVQNESLWRLDFEPRHQQITLHWIKTRRGDAQFDHANLSSARVVDRQPVGAILQDRLTLLLMLEDIRPGDVLEWCYTVESRPILLPDHCAAIFTLPAGTPIGKFYFSVLFNPARPMEWKSSVPEWQPVERQDNGEVSWIWTQDGYAGLPPEENTPDWYISHPWIQISDCPDWGMISAAFVQAWKEDDEDATVREIAGEITAGESDILRQVERAIQMVQDEYRYLAVDWELDGQPPAPPGVVARRRFGDCKDLPFLLAHLLKRLGVPARLVLVNTALRKSVAELLPAPGVFNHLLVEYQVGGETRWVDATLKRQGGGSLNRVRHDYGVGLPMTGVAAQLEEPPGGETPVSVYELNESILLDTSGAWSWLAVVVAARGSHAEALRQELESEGLEAFAKMRLRNCANRFVNARRVGALTYRDDRTANEFFLAEVFEIKDFLTLDPKSKWYKLEIANDYSDHGLKMPGEAGPRRAPFALPYPCSIVHTIELHSVALPPTVVQQRDMETDYLYFTRLRKTLAGYWTMVLTLSTLADAVPPESLDEHREAIRKIQAQSAWSVMVPPGDPRPHQRRDFGALPTSWDPASSIPALSRPRPLLVTRAGRRPLFPQAPEPGNGAHKKATVTAVALTDGEEPPFSKPGTSRLKRQKRNRRKRSTGRTKTRHVLMGCGMALILILLMVLAAKYADQLHVFHFRPPSVSTPVNSLPGQ